MRVFRNKMTNQIFKLQGDSESDKKIIKALEFNHGFEELYELQHEDLKVGNKT